MSKSKDDKSVNSNRENRDRYAPTPIPYQDIIDRFGGWEELINSELDPPLDLVNELEKEGWQKSDFLDTLEFARLPQRVQLIKQIARSADHDWTRTLVVNKERVKGNIEVLNWSDLLKERIESCRSAYKSIKVEVQDIKNEIEKNPEEYSNSKEIEWPET